MLRVPLGKGLSIEYSTLNKFKYSINKFYLRKLRSES